MAEVEAPERPTTAAGTAPEATPTPDRTPRTPEVSQADAWALRAAIPPSEVVKAVKELREAKEQITAIIGQKEAYQGRGAADRVSGPVIPVPDELSPITQAEYEELSPEERRDRNYQELARRFAIEANQKSQMDNYESYYNLYASLRSLLREGEREGGREGGADAVRKKVEDLLEASEADPDKEFRSEMLGTLLESIKQVLSDEDYRKVQNDLVTKIYARYKLHDMAIQVKYGNGTEYEKRIGNLYQDELEDILDTTGVKEMTEILERNDADYFRKLGKDAVGRQMEFMQRMDFYEFGQFDEETLSRAYEEMDRVRPQKSVIDDNKQLVPLSEGQDEIVKVVKGMKGLGIDDPESFRGKELREILAAREALKYIAEAGERGLSPINPREAERVLGNPEFDLTNDDQRLILRKALKTTRIAFDLSTKLLFAFGIAPLADAPMFKKDSRVLRERIARGESKAQYDQYGKIKKDDSGNIEYDRTALPDKVILVPPAGFYKRFDQFRGIKSIDLAAYERGEYDNDPRITGKDGFIDSVRKYRSSLFASAWAKAYREFIRDNWDELDPVDSCSGRGAREQRAEIHHAVIQNLKSTSRKQAEPELGRFSATEGTSYLVASMRRTVKGIIEHWGDDYTPIARSHGKRMIIARLLHDNNEEEGAELWYKPEVFINPIGAMLKLKETIAAKLPGENTDDLMMHILDGSTWAKRHLAEKHNYKKANNADIQMLYSIAKAKRLIKNDHEWSLIKKNISKSAAWAFVKVAFDTIAWGWALFEMAKEFLKQVFSGGK